MSDLAMTEAIATSLTVIDRAELGRYEAVIERGLETFIDVGNALAAIRDDELYRGTHATFLEYCRERWGIGKSQVYRLMNAAEVAGNLESPIGEIGESVLRPLAKLGPDQQREAWQEAVADAPDGKPTAARVEKAAAKFSEPKPIIQREVKRIRDETRKPEPMSARAVYVEPTIEATPDPEEATTITKDGGRDPHYPDEPYGMVTRTWVMDALTTAGPENNDFKSALKMVKLDDLRESIGSLSSEDKHVDARLAAFNARLDELEPVAPLDAESLSQLHPNPVIAALIDPTTPLTTIDPGSLHWAVGEATATQLNEALVLMPDALRAGRGPVLESALKKRGGVKEMMAEKRRDAAIDPRLVKAKAMIAALVNVRQQVRDNYGDLTGRDTDTLAFERSVETMLKPLMSLVDILEKGDAE